jgi:hypothetical protein
MIEKCKTCTHGYPSISCTNCGTGLRNYDSYKQPTNADRIRAMSDEELAEYIFDLGNGSEYCYGHCAFQDNCIIRGLDNGTCIKGVIDWLRAPAETEGTE